MSMAPALTLTQIQENTMRYDYFTRDNFGCRQGVRNNIFTTTRTTWSGGGRRTTRTSLFNW